MFTPFPHMMTSSNENISVLLAFCAGNSPVAGEFPSQRPVTRNFDVFFDLRMNKRLSKQSWGWWFETPSGSLWRHCNVFQDVYMYIYTTVWKWSVKHHFANSNFDIYEYETGCWWKVEKITCLLKDATNILLRLHCSSVMFIYHTHIYRSYEM